VRNCEGSQRQQDQHPVAEQHALPAPLTPYGPVIFVTNCTRKLLPLATNLGLAARIGSSDHIAVLLEQSARVGLSYGHTLR